MLTKWFLVTIGDGCDEKGLDCAGEYQSSNISPRTYCDAEEKVCKCLTKYGYHPINYYFYAPRASIDDEGISGLQLQLGIWCYKGIINHPDPWMLKNLLPKKTIYLCTCVFKLNFFILGSPGRANIGDLCIRPLIADKIEQKDIATPSMCRSNSLCYSCPEDGGGDESIGRCIEVPEPGSGFTGFTKRNYTSSTSSTTSTPVTTTSATTTATLSTSSTTAYPHIFPFDPRLAALATRKGPRLDLIRASYEPLVYFTTTPTPTHDYTEGSTVSVTPTSQSNSNSTFAVLPDKAKLANVKHSQGIGNEDLFYNYIMMLLD